MNGKIKKIFLTLTILALLPLAGCGDSGNSVKAIINGQEYDLNVDGVDIIAGGLGGSVLPGSIGYPTAGGSLSISMALSSGGYLRDRIDITALNIGGLVPGQNYLIDGQNINATVQLNGQVSQIFTATSQIVFDSLSNVSGGNVSGQFKIDLGGGYSGTLLGSFSGDVRYGF